MSISRFTREGGFVRPGEASEGRCLTKLVLLNISRLEEQDTMSFRGKVFKREASEFRKKRRTVRRINQEEIHRFTSVGIHMSMFVFRLFFNT